MSLFSETIKTIFVLLYQLLDRMLLHKSLKKVPKSVITCELVEKYKRWNKNDVSHFPYFFQGNVTATCC